MSFIYFALAKHPLYLRLAQQTFQHNCIFTINSNSQFNLIQSYYFNLKYNKLFAQLIFIKLIRLKYLFYLFDYYKMGNHCCQDLSVRPDQMELISQKLTTNGFLNQYVEIGHTEAAEVQSKLKDISMSPQFAKKALHSKVLKNKSKEKYYVGQLSQKGFPLGVGILYEPNNYIYQGQFNLIFQGVGTIELIKQQIVYTGKFKDGRAEGQGKLYSLDKLVQFEGIMANSLPRSGTMKLVDDKDPSKSCTIQLDNFPQNKSKVTYGDGRVYKGLLSQRSFTPTGKGIAHLTDNSQYQGDFVEGEMHGKGSFYWQDGSSYHGSYYHGKKHGQGTFNFSSRKYYEGQWKDGKQDGYGTYYDSYGKAIKKGSWKSGVFCKSQ